MADSPQYHLHWTSYYSDVTSALENLRNNEDFVDVTLACDGKSLKAHRVVLSACSPYFRELLKNTPCKHPVIILPDIAFVDLCALVVFIYQGEVNIHQSNLDSFVETARALNVSVFNQQKDDEENQQPLNITTTSVATPDKQKQFNVAKQQSSRKQAQTISPEDHKSKNGNSNEGVDSLSHISHKIPHLTVSSSPKCKSGHESSANGHSGSSLTRGLLNEVEAEHVEILCDSIIGDNSNDSLDTTSDQSDSNLMEHRRSCETYEHQLDPLAIAKEKLFNSVTVTLCADSMDNKGHNSQGNSVNYRTTSQGNPEDYRATSSQDYEGTIPSLENSVITTHPKWSCFMCSKMLSTKGSLRRHIRDIHSTPGVFQCSFCARCYKTQNSLNTHRYTHHKGQFSVPYQTNT